jgi:hypothetical protein
MKARHKQSRDPRGHWLLLILVLPAMFAVLLFEGWTNHEVDTAKTRSACTSPAKQEAQGDLGRTRNQQKFLTAPAKKAVTPGTLLDPSTAYPTLSAVLDTLVVDKETGLRDLVSLFQAMRGVTAGNGRQINVPVSDPGFATAKGSAVKWDDRQARKLFAELRDDRPVTLPPGE